MKCSKCGVDLPEGSQFCNVCGNKIDIILKCTNCGIDIPQGSQFCNACGTKIGAPENQSVVVKQVEVINPIQEIPVVNNSHKSSKSKKIVIVLGAAFIGIVILIIGMVVLLGVIGAFTYGMTSGYHDTQSTNSNQNVINNGNAQQAAYNDYINKVQAVKTQADLMESYTTPGNQPTNLGDYRSFLDSYKTQIDTYESKCNDAIAAGRIYRQYLAQGSSDYNTITSTETQLTSSVTQLRQSYAQLETEYNTALQRQNAYNDYDSKLRMLEYANNDLKSYVNSTDSFTQLTQAWLAGYKQRVDTYVTRGNDVINSGRTYQQYLSPGTQAYNSVANNEQIINTNIQLYQDNYNQIESNYQSIQGAGNLLKWLLPVFAA